MTSLLRQNDVATSFWRNDNVFITPCVHWGLILSMMSINIGKNAWSNFFSYTDIMQLFAQSLFSTEALEYRY